MFRSSEIKILILIMCLVGLMGVVAGLFVSVAAVILVFVVSVLLIVSALLFTHWRYKEVGKLSGYLKRISNGDYTLDIRDNYEGELSILKSDIYKVTLMLSEQGSLLKKDKVKLTEAISDISHQLKTPLTSMMVMTDLLSDDGLPVVKRKEFTHNIRVQLERIEWLVSSLLKLSKIDAGTAIFKREKVIVKDLIEKTLEPMLIPIDVKEQTVLLEGDETVSFLGDLNWTIEALINIVKNCVEHTATGGELSISFAENLLFTEIIITDNGKGIPKEDLPYIFNRFYKGKSGGEDSIGIGLAMAYSIITSQQGDIEIKSAEGKGTEFRVKFYKK